MINPHEAMELLRKSPNHPLWNKKIIKWTQTDIENIKNCVENNIQINKKPLAPRVKNSFNKHEAAADEMIFNSNVSEKELHKHQEELLK